ncbi:unnamed protein product [Urochloa humidicola]
MERTTPLGTRPKRRRRKIDLDVWLSLPPELLVEVFRHLDTTYVVSCAATCKPWRRAIIANASSLRPRPDCYNPNLLLGFFYQCQGALLQRVPGPLESTLPASTGSQEGHYERPCDLILATCTGGIDLSLYNWPLSSRDGFLLLESLSTGMVDLCLCNPMTGASMLLPAAAFQADAYVLLTGDDLSRSESVDNAAVLVRIVAMKSEYHDGIMTLQHQHFCCTLSSGNGSWGHTEEIKKPRIVSINHGAEVVCGGAMA